METLCIVKPHVLSQEEKILWLIGESGLVCVEPLSCEWTEPMVRFLCRGSEDVLKMAMEYLLGHPAHLYIIRGEKAVERFYQLAGTAVAPNECARETIRYRFGEHTPRLLPSGTHYWLNAVHRPINPAEALVQLSEFYGGIW